MRWLNQFISNNNKKREEKAIEKKAPKYYDYLKTLSFDEINVLYSEKKAALSIKKSIRSLLVGGLLLSFLSSVFVVLKKIIDLYGTDISGGLTKEVASVYSPISILIIFVATIFFSVFLIIVSVYYKDTKQLAEQVTLIESIKEEKNKKK